MFTLFANNLLPVFLVAGAGYLFGAWGKINPRPLAQVAFFVLAPCLIFQIILENGWTVGSMARMGGFAALTLLVLGATTFLLARILRWSRTMTAAAVLVVMLPNAGNFGLSATLFAFGEPGLADASLFFVTASMLTYTVGVLVASMGRASIGDACLGLLRVPTIWAVVIGFMLVQLGWSLPFPVQRTVDLLADACIPVFLIVLGMQLCGATWRGQTGPLIWATGLRLVGGIGVALVVALVFGLSGSARQAGILEAAMPSAVINTILATQYDVEPGFVTSAVLVTTVLSPLTLTPLLSYLGA